jgi:hypothetical protein
MTCLGIEVVNLLLVHERSADAIALVQTFASRAEIRTAATLHAAIAIVQQENWRPDMLIVEPDVADITDGLALLQLRSAIEPAALIVGAASAGPAIEAQFWRGVGAKRPAGAAHVTLDTIFEEQRALTQALSLQRLQQGAEIERAATRAAEVAVARALDQLVKRLGLEDAEGLRLAVRFARAWETAKGKFFSAVTTGIASAFLLAIGAGIISMLRHAETK